MSVRRLLTALVALVLAAIVYVVVQVLRPVPAFAVTAAARLPTALPGAAPHPRWPAGAEAAVGLSGVGPLAGNGGDQELAIASLAKMMTAYLVVRGHPLAPGASGPSITVTRADAASYTVDQKQGDSVVKVTAGEKLTEQQALAALLLPSGDNIADLLARWDAGSDSAFVGRMNAEARALGMDHTHYADPSGVSAATVSTARDQLELALRVMSVPALRQIVAMPQVTLPVAGVSYNVNYALGQDGIVGIKTGSTPQAGGCLAFAADKTVDGETATVVGVVLGVQPTKSEPSELKGVTLDSETLLNSVSGSLRPVRLVRAGTVLGRVGGPWTTGSPVRADSGVAVTGWPGTPVAVTVAGGRLARSVAAGQRVGTATVTVGTQVRHIPLSAVHAVTGPTLRWRLTRI